jgi:hypothetical protein
MSGGLKLDNIIFTGRTYDEYVRMFNLSQGDLETNTFFICPGGASSFTAHAAKNGFQVRAGDILYGLSKEELERLGQTSMDTTRAKMKDVVDGYNWDEFGDVEGLLRERISSLLDFLYDYEKGLVEKRYIQCTLPQLPLADGVVDIVLSDHLLFTYPQFLDYKFHVGSIEEMVRVAKNEVRLFPLISSATGTRPPFFDDIIRHLHELGLKTAIEATSKYHFQVGSNEMLRILK